MKKEHEDKQQPTASDLPIVMLTPCSTNQTGRPQKQTMAAIKILPFNSQQAAFCLDLQRLQFEAGCGRWKIWTPRSDGTALKQFWKFSEKKNESSFYTVYCTVYLLIFLGILSHLWFSGLQVLDLAMGTEIAEIVFWFCRNDRSDGSEASKCFSTRHVMNFLSCQRMFSWCFFKKHKIIWNNFLYLLHSCPQCERLNCDSCLNLLTSATILTGYKQASTYQLHSFKQEMLLYDGQYIECPWQTLGIVAPGSLCLLTVSVV